MRTVMTLLAWMMASALGVTPCVVAMELSVESKVVRQGEPFTLQINVQDSLELGHLFLDVDFPVGSLEMLDAQAEEVALATVPGNESQTALYVMNPADFPAAGHNRLRFAWVFAEGYTGSGKVLTLQLKTGATAQKEAIVRIAAVAAVSAAEPFAEHPVQTHDGVLSVQLYGDLDGDGRIEADDAIRVLQHVVGQQPLSGDLAVLADVSGQQGITAYDAALILMQSAGAIATFPVLEERTSVAPLLASTRRQLSIGDPEFRQDTVSVPLVLDNADGIAAGNIRVQFNADDLLFVGAKPTTLTATHSLRARADGDELRITFAGYQRTQGVGDIVLLEFRVRNGYAEEAQLVIQEARFNEETQPRLSHRYIAFVPDETKLLPNYPNPFNPETWIPYQLARDAEVSVSIYDVVGRQVRAFSIGHQLKGYYTSKGRALYWDGRNGQGERTASGLYIYRMRADREVFIRKLLVVK